MWGGITAKVAGFLVVRIIASVSEELLPPSEGIFMLASFVIIGVGLIVFGRIKNSKLRTQPSSEQSVGLESSAGDQ